MNIKDYCETVLQKETAHKHLYSTILVEDNKSPLVDLKDTGLNFIFEHSVKKNYKYLVRQEIAEKLDRINEKLKTENKALIILCVWRSFYHQRLIWEHEFDQIQQKFPLKRIDEIIELVSHFIAREKFSMHSTGGSVDALIYDAQKDCVLDFGNNIGTRIELNTMCYPYFPEISDEAKKNRKLLIDLFEAEDFVCNIKEYWNFNFGNTIWAIEKGRSKTVYDIIYA